MADETKAFTVRLPEAAYDELNTIAKRRGLPRAILAREMILENLPGWQMYLGRKFDTGSDPVAPDLEQQRRVEKKFQPAQDPQGSRAERRRKKRGK